MKYIESNNTHFTLIPKLCKKLKRISSQKLTTQITTRKTTHLAFAMFLINAPINNALAESIPEGYFLLPNGEIMAENPETATAPDGYHLRPNGTLFKLGLDIETEQQDDLALATNIKPTHTSLNNQLISHTPYSSEKHYKKGIWMAEYKFTYMNMSDLIDGASKITAQTATNPNNKYNYMIAPSNLSISMHTGKLTYGFSEDFLASLKVSYITNNMNILSSDSTKSQINTSGIGDTEIAGLFKGPYNVNFRLGLSIPTGSVSERGPITLNATSTQANVKYPYQLQLGSGSYELIQGIEYSDVIKSISWGANYELTARLNQNQVDYKRGNSLEIEGWTQWNVLSMLSLKTNIMFYSQGKITGIDSEIDSSLIPLSPTYNAINYGGNRIDVGGSAIFKLPNNDYNVITSFSMPVRQTLWGPQMAASWTASISVGAIW